MSIPAYKNERKNPTSAMTSGPQPRYRYTSPTEKAQFGKPPQLGTDINSYALSDIDVQSARRNFPGYGVAQYFTLADMQNGDSAGTTETDSVTMKSEGGYTTINNKNTKQRSKWNSNRS